MPHRVVYEHSDILSDDDACANEWFLSLLSLYSWKQKSAVYGFLRTFVQKQMTIKTNVFRPSAFKQLDEQNLELIHISFLKKYAGKGFSAPKPKKKMFTQ